MRQGLAGLLALVVVALTALAIGGQSRLDGPVLVHLTTDHGLHRGDLVPLLLGGIVLVGLAALARTPGRPVKSVPGGRHVRVSTR
jgi:hypothetical protein